MNAEQFFNELKDRTQSKEVGVCIHQGLCSVWFLAELKFDFPFQAYCDVQNKRYVFFFPNLEGYKYTAEEMSSGVPWQIKEKCKALFRVESSVGYLAFYTE